MLTSNVTHGPWPFGSPLSKELLGASVWSCLSWSLRKVVSKIIQNIHYNFTKKSTIYSLDVFTRYQYLDVCIIHVYVHKHSYTDQNSKPLTLINAFLYACLIYLQRELDCNPEILLPPVSLLINISLILFIKQEAQKPSLTGATITIILNNSTSQNKISW